VPDHGLGWPRAHGGNGVLTRDPRLTGDPPSRTRFGKSSPRVNGRYVGPSHPNVPEKHIVISPHFDDGALSVAGTIVELGGRTIMVTVHGGEPMLSSGVSEWDQLCGFVTGKEAAAIRRIEDINACFALGASFQHLPYADSPYLDGRPIAASLCPQLINVMAEARSVFIPAAIGGHPDHVRARDLALSAAEAHPQIEVMLYADLPYAASAANWGDASFGTIDPSGELFDSLRPVLDSYWLSGPDILDLSAATWSKKRRAVLSHASQLPPLAQYWRELTAYPGPLGHELLWRVSPKSLGPPPGRPWIPSGLIHR
jgi:LmbE family N-acetylglucosaminyl deacetylase